MTPQAFNQMIQDDIARMMKPTHYVAQCFSDDGEEKVVRVKAYNCDEAYELVYEETEDFCDTGAIFVEVDKGQYDEIECEHEGYFPYRRK